MEDLFWVGVVKKDVVFLSSDWSNQKKSKKKEKSGKSILKRHSNWKERSKTISICK